MFSVWKVFSIFSVTLVITGIAVISFFLQLSRTALDIARPRGHTEVCKILQSYK